MSKAISILMGCVASLIICGNSLAYKKPTHQSITRISLNKSDKFKLFLKEVDLDYSIPAEMAVFGSYAEDLDGKFFFHFYDPIYNHGLGTAPLTFSQSFVWGYTHDYPQNDFSWTQSRLHMFNGLTSESKIDRDSELNIVFRSLGHLIHLIQDMAQPSHVRNDPHASHFEPLGSVLAPIINPSHLEDWAITHSGEVIAFSGTALDPFPVASFEQPFLSLAFLSNRNFFSDDTIFEDYPQPAIDETNYTDDYISRGIGDVAKVLAEDGQVYEVPYIIKTRGAYAGMKLAQVGYFGARIHNLPIRNLAFQIDDQVARENAAILIPLAVSYSAGLLDYFFRGNIDAESDGDDGIIITNKSNEAMVGMFALYYDNDEGIRKQVEEASWNLSLSPGEESDKLTFIAPEDIEESGKYILVFKGQLGQEGLAGSTSKFAVAAKNILLSSGPDYLFIIPETVEIHPPSSQSDNFSMQPTCGWPSGTFSRNSITRIWDMTRQRISGHFVSSGSAYIKKIQRSTFGYIKPNVYLDGALIDQDTWVGDPDNQPKTWELESLHTSSNQNLPLKFIVQLSNGELFEAPLLAFGIRTWEFHSITGTWYCDYNDVVIRHYRVSASGYFSIKDYSPNKSYEIVSLAGYSFDAHPQCVEPLNDYYICHSTWHGFEEIYIAGNPPASSSPLGYFPAMSTTAEAKYITSEAEANHLEELGISPIDFTVIMK